MRGILTRLTAFPVGSGQREDIVLLIESTPAACTDEQVRKRIHKGDFDVVVTAKCRFDADAWTSGHFGLCRHSTRASTLPALSLSVATTKASTVVDNLPPLHLCES